MSVVDQHVTSKLFSPRIGWITSTITTVRQHECFNARLRERFHNFLKVLPQSRGELNPRSLRSMLL
ncbi:hypothetical protein ES703_41399 [subsurface metagenome]